jgi:two-component system, LuxR family, response regulator FixJ
MSTPIEVALVDDDPDVLESTRLVLEGEGLSLRTHASAEALLADLERGRNLDCIVSDVRMGGMSGIELQEQLLARGFRQPLILVTGHGDVSTAVSAIKAGASDFIEKPFDATRLAETIRASVETARRSEAVERRRAVACERAKLLSARQRQVMNRVVDGYSSKQIAADLGISPRTVETYRLWIMERMGAGSLAELVRMAALLDDDGT